ncbi:hypothetical protein EYF80_024661 [Liparis tanakae]|uniref:Uncharacterized protein n=1 Tax=Liparis tanakae TaxID=230148 RepID=A0A4Z2HJW0_9TELE|nr:hypothetical protein EYF80_024661 [Liparis tanakae]
MMHSRATYMLSVKWAGAYGNFLQTKMEVLKDIKEDASDGGRKCGGWVGLLRHSCATELVDFMAMGANKLHPPPSPTRVHLPSLTRGSHTHRRVAPPPVPDERVQHLSVSRRVKAAAKVTLSRGLTGAISDSPMLLLRVTSVVLSMVSPLCTASRKSYLCEILPLSNRYFVRDVVYPLLSGPARVINERRQLQVGFSPTYTQHHAKQVGGHGAVRVGAFNEEHAEQLGEDDDVNQI